MWSQVLTEAASPFVKRADRAARRADRSLDPSPFIVEPERGRRAFPHRRWPLRTSSAPDLEHWDLRVFGAVTDELRFTWQDLSCLPEIGAFVHTELGSRRRPGRHWQGVDLASVLALAGARGDADWLIVHGEGGYQRELPLNQVLAGPAFLADQVDGIPVSNRQGGPLRLILPEQQARFYCKWVRGLELRTDISH